MTKTRPQTASTQFGRSALVSIADQGVLSAFNLALNLTLIALAAPAEFGRFIFAITLVLIFSSVQNAIICMPISVLLPGKTAMDQNETLGDIVSIDVPFRLAAGLAAAALAALSDISADYLIASGLVVMATLSRETVRAVHFATDATRRALLLDTAMVVLSIAATAALWPLLPPAVAALGGLAIGNALAAFVLGRGLLPAIHSPRQALTRYRPIWRETRWSLIGASTAEVHNRFYVFALEAFRGLEVLATVQAGRLLLGPFALFAGALQRVARPQMAKAIADDDFARLRMILMRGLGFLLAISIVYCAAIWFAWPVLERMVFKGKYPAVGLATALWTAHAVLATATSYLSTYMQATFRLQVLAYVSMAAAALSSTLLFGLGLGVPAFYAIGAVIAGQVLALIWVFELVRRDLATRSVTDDGTGANAVRIGSLPEADHVLRP